MNESSHEALRQRITEELDACRRNMAQLEESAKPISPDRAIGRLSRMDSIGDQAISSAALSQNREKLYQLEQALEKIDRPGFGICLSCGQPIPIERLMALPESTRCVACASR